jgi:hypothetical protein
MEILVPLLSILFSITGLWLMVRLIALADSMKRYFDWRIVNGDK